MQGETVIAAIGFISGEGMGHLDALVPPTAPLQAGRIDCNRHLLHPEPSLFRSLTRPPDYSRVHSDTAAALLPRMMRSCTTDIGRPLGAW